MMFAQAIVLLSALAASASAVSFIPGELTADSKSGLRLLSKATEVRDLENRDEQDSSWLVGYSIKYLGCASLMQVNSGEGQGGNDENNQAVYTQQLVKFGICKSGGSCSTCTGEAQYVVDMNTFVDAYTEMKMDALEQTCENIRENCNCNDDANDDESCEYQCYTDAGMYNDCLSYQNGEEVNIQEMLQCAGKKRYA
jgi:hypothetical protein